MPEDRAADKAVEQFKKDWAKELNRIANEPVAQANSSQNMPVAVQVNSDNNAYKFGAVDNMPLFNIFLGILVVIFGTWLAILYGKFYKKGSRIMSNRICKLIFASLLIFVILLFASLLVLVFVFDCSFKDTPPLLIILAPLGGIISVAYMIIFVAYILKYIYGYLNPIYSRSREVRLWTFISIVWIIFTSIFIILFKPFGKSNWNFPPTWYHNVYTTDVILKIIFILIFPIAIGIVRYLYIKLVK